mgnify:CR=1 FL=1
MKNTALTTTHEALGAKMVPFAGYNMPVSYEGVTAEHETVRTSVGVFDVSHMGEFLITGPNALALIQKVTSNDASKLVDGQAQYSCFPNATGGIVDDLIVYRLEAEKWLLVVNASNIEKDWNWISQHNDLNVEMENR